MTVDNPQFNDNGALTFCDECPFFDAAKHAANVAANWPLRNPCTAPDGYDCPTEDTYQQAAEAAREGR